jgi:hypothetical protein
VRAGGKQYGWNENLNSCEVRGEWKGDFLKGDGRVEGNSTIFRAITALAFVGDKSNAKVISDNSNLLPPLQFGVRLSGFPAV